MSREEALWASRLSSIERNIVELLATGSSRHEAAASAYVSLRFVDRVIAGMTDQLGTVDAFVRGVRAVGAGAVAADRVLAGCAPHRSSTHWTKPSDRANRIIRQLAAGLGPEQIAPRTGVSERTVRRDLSAFARANGARTLMAAGALCEALGLT